MSNLKNNKEKEIENFYKYFSIKKTKKQNKQNINVNTSTTPVENFVNFKYNTIEEQYKKKKEYLNKINKNSKLLMTKPKESNSIKLINYKINIEFWRYRKYLFDYNEEQSIKELKSSKLLKNMKNYSQNELSNEIDKINEETSNEKFDYFKKQILLENYDEYRENSSSFLECIVRDYSVIDTEKEIFNKIIDKYLDLYKEFESKDINSENFTYFMSKASSITLENKNYCNNYDKSIFAGNDIDNSYPNLLLNDIIVHCKTSWFDHDGNIEWIDCILLFYFKPKNIFRVAIKKLSNNDYLVKNVTRFNIKFNKENNKFIKQRINQAVKLREKANKYLALDYFISSFDIDNLNIPMKLVNNNFLTKILYRAFVYKAPLRSQITPLEYDKLPNHIKFGISAKNQRKTKFPEYSIMNKKVKEYFNYIQQKTFKDLINHYKKTNNIASEEYCFNVNIDVESILNNEFKFNLEDYNTNNIIIKKVKSSVLPISIKYELINNYFNEYKELYFKRAFQIMSFLTKLPLNIKLYNLLNEVLPNKKFKISSELFLYPCNNLPFVKFKRDRNYLDAFESIQSLLHQSEEDLTYILFEFNKEIYEKIELGNIIFFYTHWLAKPVKLADFKEKNIEKIEATFKDLSLAISRLSQMLIKSINERNTQIQKINKEAKIPFMIICKFRNFQYLLNKKIEHWVFNLICKSINYIKELLNNSCKLVVDNVNKYKENLKKIKDNKIIKEAELAKLNEMKFSKRNTIYNKANYTSKDKFNDFKSKKFLNNKESKINQLSKNTNKLSNNKSKINLEQSKALDNYLNLEPNLNQLFVLSDVSFTDLILIRNDNYIEYLFNSKTEYMQFEFELKCKKDNLLFYIKPSQYEFTECLINKLFDKELLSKLKTLKSINIYELLTKEQQDNYFNLILDLNLNIIKDDNQLIIEDKIQELRSTIECFFSPVNKLVSYLNNNISKDLSEMFAFSASNSANRYKKEKDKHIYDVNYFREKIDINKKFLVFFNDLFTYEKLFLGNIILNTIKLKEELNNKLENNLEDIYSLLLKNNEAISLKIEVEEKEIKSYLNIHPKTVEQYDELMIYCKTFKQKLSKINGYIDEQQQNATLLDENFKEIKANEYYKMWKCYGIPKNISLERALTLDRLLDRQLEFKELLKQDDLKLLIKINEIKERFEDYSINYCDIGNYIICYKKFNGLDYDISSTIEDCDKLNKHQNIVENPVTDFQEIKDIAKVFKNYYRLWTAVYDFLTNKALWLCEHLKKIDRKTLKSTYDNVISTIDYLEKNIFKRDKPKPYKLIQDLRDIISEFKPNYPLLYDLRNPDLKQNHIEDLSKDIGINIPIDLSISLENLLNKGILNYAESINERSTYASGQKKLAFNLEKYKEKFKNLKLSLCEFKNSDMLILKDTILLSEELESLLTKIVNMQSSKYAKYLLKDIQVLWHSLNKSQELIDIWVKTQKLLEQQFQIFNFGDLRKQLAEEYLKYENIEKQWRILLEQVKSTPNIQEVYQISKIKETLLSSCESLEYINKKLSDYLDTKRSSFARFFFISNEELTLMLSSSFDPSIIANEYIQQVFEGIKKLKICQSLQKANNNNCDISDSNQNISNNSNILNSQNSNKLKSKKSLKSNKKIIHNNNNKDNLIYYISSMISELGEEILFVDNILPYEQINLNNNIIHKPKFIEIWLQDVEYSMKKTMHNNIINSFRDLNSKEYYSIELEKIKQTINNRNRQANFNDKDITEQRSSFIKGFFSNLNSDEFSKMLEELIEKEKNIINEKNVSVNEIKLEWIEKWNEQSVLAVSLLDWTLKVTDSLKYEESIKNEKDQVYFSNSNMLSNLDYNIKYKNKTTELYAIDTSSTRVINKHFKKPLKDLYSDLLINLESLVSRIKKGTLSKRLKVTLVNLIIQEVHCVDVVSKLVKSNVNEIHNFEWLSQLRYYLIKDKYGKYINRKNLKYSEDNKLNSNKENILEYQIDNLVLSVNMLNTEKLYDYEYLGNQKRLVITPLTDRCYRTLMEAINNCLGGAPEGPAGTGKTETIKDLSRNLGIKCFTYNCSDESNFELLCRFFKGIAISGSWVCFDEFNRISVDVLSIISHQISILLNAQRMNATLWEINRMTYPFNSNMGVFITMNPDYAGRSQLPDNLKVLFRPIAMMIPDYRIITEIMLYSFGFNSARNLSTKIVSSLKLASEQLSSQDHYDYGMRTLNGIIQYIGNLSTKICNSVNKDSDKNEVKDNRNLSNDNTETLILNKESKDANSISDNLESTKHEEYLCQKAIRDSNMPKFIKEDYDIYEGILDDLFPNSNFVQNKNKLLLECIYDELENNNLPQSKYLISKIIDFHNLISVRHAVMLVGESMTSKSTIFKIYTNSAKNYYKLIQLKNSDINKSKSIKSKVINPKSITSSQLFGWVDKKTLEFNEGFCSKTLKEYYSDTSNDIKILLFDGPVDTIWIENMNSVLDDTKKLCLENSDLVRIDENTLIIFEVDDLSHASLATISRCGMVYTDRNSINPDDYFSSWIKTLPKCTLETNMIDLINNFYYKFFSYFLNKVFYDEFNKLKFNLKLPFFKSWMVRNFYLVLEAFLFNNIKKEDIINSEIEKDQEIIDKQAEEQTNNTNDNVLNANKKGKNLANTYSNNAKKLDTQDKQNLFNKLLMSFLITFNWQLDSLKDLKCFNDNFFILLNLLSHDDDFLFKEELLLTNKLIIGNDINNLIINCYTNQFYFINNFLKDNHEKIYRNLVSLSSTNSFNILIPTKDTYKAEFITNIALIHNTSLLYYGQTATGKSILLKNLFSNINKMAIECINESDSEFTKNVDNEYELKGFLKPKYIDLLTKDIILNAKTSSNNLCDLIEEKVAYRLKKNVISPPANKTCVILIEDLNMPIKERFGAQPPIEILRQNFDYNGFYDRKENDFVYVNNVLYFSCLTLGRQLVSNRLLWHYLPVYFKEINETNLKNIYQLYYAVQMNQYNNNIRKLDNFFSEVLINAYNLINKLFKPLPSTPHYSFNVRDINKVFNGFKLISNESLQNDLKAVDKISILIFNEMTRVFYDRLSNDESRDTYKNQIVVYLDKHLNLNKNMNVKQLNLIEKSNKFLSNELLEDQSSDTQNLLKKRHSKSISIDNTYNLNNKYYFEDILFSTLLSVDNTYSIIDDVEELKRKLYNYLFDYNTTKKSKEKIDIIFFDYSIKHILRLERLFLKSNEHALLIGLTGSGRESLLTIASFIKKFKIYKIRGSDEVEDYQYKDWQEDIKSLCIQTGVRLEESIFIIKDSSIKDGNSYIDLNSFISSGFIYNLYSNEEKQDIISQLRNVKEVEDLNLQDENSIWNFFTKSAASNTKIGLCLNPLNNDFSKILRTFPAFIYNTYIDWFSNWPQPALYELANREFLSINDLEKFSLEYINVDYVNINNTVNIVNSKLPANRNINFDSNNSIKEQASSEENKKSDQSIDDFKDNSFLDNNDNDNLDFNLDKSKNLSPIEVNFNIKNNIANKLSLIFSNSFNQLITFNKKYCLDLRKKVIILPKTFLDSINYFKSFSIKYIQDIENNISKYKTGVIKIEEAEKTIKEMSDNIEIQKPILEEKSKFLDKTNKEIELRKTEALKFKEQCEIKEAEAYEKSKEADALKKIADANINEAELKKEEINTNIMSIKAQDCSTLKKLLNPPKEIPKMMQAIFAIMNNFEKKPLNSLPTDWKFYQKILVDIKFLDKLKSYPTKLDNYQFSDKTVQLLQPYINDSTLEPKNMNKISSACKIFCVYFKSMFELDQLLKYKLIPSKEELKNATESYNLAEEERLSQINNLNLIENEVFTLEQDFDRFNLEKLRIENEIVTSIAKLNRAEKLSVSLKTEKIRWKEVYEKLENDKKYLLGNSIICCFYISFLVPYLDYYRQNFIKDFLIKIIDKYNVDLKCNDNTFINSINSQNIIKEQKKISSSTKSLTLYNDDIDISIADIIGDRFKIQDWIAKGLPSDKGNIDNAVALFNSIKPVLLLDPQKQGLKFLKKMFYQNFIMFKKFDNNNNSSSGLKLIEICIKEGKVLIFDYINNNLHSDIEALVNAEIIYKEKEIIKTTVNKEERNKNIIENTRLIDNTLNKKHITSAKIIKLNELQEIEANPMFNYYLISNSPNPEFESELYGKLCMINFTVTNQGLTEQLLSIITREESPNDEIERLNILQKQSELSLKLQTFEDNILQKLSLSSETLLENDILVDKLDESKKLADDAALQINQANISEERIKIIRNNYLVLAKTATVLFFCLQDLCLINSVYYYSIDWFIKSILIKSIKDVKENISILINNLKESKEKASTNEVNLNNNNTCLNNYYNDIYRNYDISVYKDNKIPLSEKLIFLKESLLNLLYKSVCQSLFNKDKLLFSFLILSKILLSNNIISEIHTNFMFKNTINIDFKEEDHNKIKEIRKNIPNFIEENQWEDLIKLSYIEDFKNITDDIINNADKYKEWFDKYCYNSDIKFDNNKDICNSLFDFFNENYNKLHCYKKLLFIKIISLNKLDCYIKYVIQKELSLYLSTLPFFTISELYKKHSTCSTPLFLLLSEGVDPTEEVKKLAEENKRELIMLSLGKGQTDKAIKSIDMTLKKGEWIFLQNLHLVPEFMKLLEATLNNFEQINDKDPNQVNFRLWLSAIPSKDILPNVLMNCLKISNESPVGVKSNMLKLLNLQEKKFNYENEILSKVNKDYEYSKFLISLMYFHSIIIERKNYGSLGWNINYNFNLNDFNISKNILRFYLEKYEKIQYEAMKYLIVNCIYGGKITEELDRRTLLAILEDLINEEVLNKENYIVNSCNNYNICFLDDYYKYLNQFESLPEITSSNVVGLHYNALIKKNEEINKSILIELANINTSSSGNNYEIKLNILTNISNEIKLKLNVSTLLKTINNIHEEKDVSINAKEGFDLDKIRSKFKIEYYNSMNSILIQEVMRYNKLIFLVFDDVENVVKAYKGLIPLTDNIEEVSFYLLSNKTPISWIKASYPSKKPVNSWIDDLQQRLYFFKKWENEGTPSKFWLSAFFFTHTFLTGIKQNYARLNKIEIDKLDYNFEFVNNNSKFNLDANNINKYYIYGLYLEGAEWSSSENCIVELSDNKIYSKMPPIIISVKVVDHSNKNIEDEYSNSKTNSNNNENLKNVEYYDCPVYKCSSRQGSLTTTGHSSNYVSLI